MNAVINGLSNLIMNWHRSHTLKASDYFEVSLLRRSRSTTITMKNV